MTYDSLIFDLDGTLWDMAETQEGEMNLYPGVKIGLEMLAKRFPLFIVSNCPKGYIEEFYRVSGLGAYFRDQECYGNTGEAKAQNIQKVIDRNQLKNPIYIGDTVGDSRAARACKIPFIHILYTYGLKVECDFTAQSFEEVVGYFFIG